MLFSNKYIQFLVSLYLCIVLMENFQDYTQYPQTNFVEFALNRLIVFVIS